MTVAPLIAVPAVGVNDVIVREWTPTCEVLPIAELTVQVRAPLFTVTAAEMADGIVLVYVIEQDGLVVKAPIVITKAVAPKVYD